MSGLKLVCVFIVVGILFGVSQAIDFEGPDIQPDQEYGNVTLDTMNNTRLWKIGYLRIEAWFFYYDNLTTDSTNITKDYFSNANVSMTNFDSADGIWAAFNNNFTSPVFDQFYQTINFTAMNEYESLNLTYFLNAEGKITIMDYFGNETTTITSKDTGEQKWETINIPLHNTRSFNLIIDCYNTTKDLVLIDSIVVFQSPPVARPSPSTYTTTEVMFSTTIRTTTTEKAVERTSTASTSKKPPGSIGAGNSANGVQKIPCIQMLSLSIAIYFHVSSLLGWSI